MKSIVCFILALIFPLSVAHTQIDTVKPTAYVPVLRFDPDRDAEKDISDAVAEATRSGRRIILDVGGEWCKWCHRLDTLFMKYTDLAELRDAKFVVVKINFSKENENERVLSRYPEIKGYPHLFVLDKDGTLLHSQDTGLLEAGKGYNPVKVRAFLDAWGPTAAQSDH